MSNPDNEFMGKSTYNCNAHSKRTGSYHTIPRFPEGVKQIDVLAQSLGTSNI